MNRKIEVIDARGPGALVTGTQAQAIDASRHARRTVEGCNVAIVVVFIPAEGGQHRVEVGLDGRGPPGMASIVHDTLQTLAVTLGEAMHRQELDHRGGAPS